MTPRETIALFALAAVWGGSFLFIRVASAALGPATLMAGRVLIAAWILGMLALVRRRPFHLRRHAPDLLFLGLVNAAVPFTLIAIAELRLTASLAAMLNATVPLFSALLSVVWLGEPLTGRRVAGLSLGLAGVFVLMGWSPPVSDRWVPMSMGAMLLAAFCYAVSGVYVKKRLASVSPTTLALGQQLAAGAWLVGPAVWLHPVRMPGAIVLWALLGLAVLSTALAYVLYFYLIARIGPTRTYTVTYLIPLFGMLWGAWFLGERITHGMLAGLACITGSMMLVNGLGFTRKTARMRNGRAEGPAGDADKGGSDDSGPARRYPLTEKSAALRHPPTERGGLAVGFERVLAGSGRQVRRDDTPCDRDPGSEPVPDRRDPDAAAGR